MATHPSIVAWRILWTEEPGGLWSTGLQRVGHNWSDLACMHATTYLRLLIFLPAILIPACDSFSPAFHMMYSGKPLQSWKKPSERTAERSSSHWGREAFCPAAWSSSARRSHSSEETDAPEFSCVVNTCEAGTRSVAGLSHAARLEPEAKGEKSGILILSLFKIWIF